MGRKRRVTAIGFSQGQSKIKCEILNKKMKISDPTSLPGQVQIGKNQNQELTAKVTRKEGASINDLPTEMLMEILEFVDSRSLFKCRLQNRLWCLISTGILQKRPTFPKSFDLSGVKGDLRPWELRRKPRSLKKFVRLMKTGKNSPFSHFHFLILNYSAQLELFDHPGFTQFLSNFHLSVPSNQNQNQNIKGVKLQVFNLDGENLVPSLAEKLGDFLLHKIPGLEEISIQFRFSDEAPNVNLFPALQSAAAPELFQLPHLKIIRFENPFHDSLISAYTQMIKDLLLAAVNLQQLYLEITNSEDFTFLHSLGKLELLKGATVKMICFFSTQQHQQQQQQPPQRLMNFPTPVFPKLETLNIKLYGVDSTFQSQAIKFLSNLFESSQNTLKTLKIQQLTILSQVQLPIFKNLNKLSVSVIFDMRAQAFPPGIRSLNIFPALEFLELGVRPWARAFPSQDSIPRLPSVKTLVLKDRELDADAIFILARMCPNVKNLEIGRDSEFYESLA